MLDSVKTHQRTRGSSAIQEPRYGGVANATVAPTALTASVQTCSALLSKGERTPVKDHPGRIGRVVGLLCSVLGYAQRHIYDVRMDLVVAAAPAVAAVVVSATGSSAA